MPLLESASSSSSSLASLMQKQENLRPLTKKPTLQHKENHDRLQESADMTRTGNGAEVPDDESSSYYLDSPWQNASDYRYRRQTLTGGGAFVHLGKTGGSSLSVLLRNGCHSWLPHPCRTAIVNESAASHWIVSYYHVADMGLLPRSQHATYVISIRDPLLRTLSALQYHHALNVQARNEWDTIHHKYRRRYQTVCQTCFPTLEHFVRHLGDDIDKSNDVSLDFTYPFGKNEMEFQPPRSSCTDFVRALFHGRVRPFIHLYFNYQRLLELLPSPQQETTTALSSSSDVVWLVTRLEHLWEDWKVVNHFVEEHYPAVTTQQAYDSFRQQEDDPQAATVHHHHHHHSNPDENQNDTTAENNGIHIRNTAHLNLPVSRTLSPSAQAILCRALQSEYNAYFQILGQAQNINRADLIQALVTARQACPHVTVDLQFLAQAAKHKQNKG